MRTCYPLLVHLQYLLYFRIPIDGHLFKKRGFVTVP
jgi:hypothetical protein